MIPLAALSECDQITAVLEQIIGIQSVTRKRLGTAVPVAIMAPAMPFRRLHVVDDVRLRVVVRVHRHGFDHGSRRAARQ